MAGVLIGLIISFVLFFILTRRIFVRVIKEKDLIIQLHLPLLALHLKSEGKDNQRKKSKSTEKRRTQKPGVRAYIKLITEILSRVRGCGVVVKRVVLPCNAENFGSLTLVNPFAYQGLIYAAIAYLRTKIADIELEDNAIISSPDVKEIQFYLTVKMRLFNLIYTLLTLRKGLKMKEGK